MNELSICIPCREQVYSEFAYSLAELTAELTHAGIKHTVHMRKGSMLPEQRAHLVTEALEIGSSYILWLDSDMTFPSDIYQLLRRQDQDIIACTYSTKDNRNMSVAFRELNGEACSVSLIHGEAVEVDAVGMGVMLTRTSVFSYLPQPWFQFYWDHDRKYYNGEDVYFCEQAREAGYSIHVNFEASNLIGHCGTRQYKL
jgi:hypothetical protein